MKISLVVAPQDAGCRLDVALKTALPEYSRAQIQKAIRNGACLVDGAIALAADQKLAAGQAVAIDYQPPDSRLQASSASLEILWRDKDLAVIVKPAGLTSHPCPSCREETLAHRLLGHFPELAAQGGERPGIVHRLDKDTSGVMLVALTEGARLSLAKAFAQRQIHKQYLALVAGDAPASGECCAPIGRHPTIKTRMAQVAEQRGGRPARTTWRKLWSNGKISLLAVSIASGRTHQIRVHLAAAGLPILGDATYAPAATAAMAKRQMLHAWRISLEHPLSGEDLAFCAPVPPDFLETAMAASAAMARIVVTGSQGCGKSSFCADLAARGMPAISADAIVARLYAGKSDATDWIGDHFGADALTAGGAVDKKALFRLLELKPHLRTELERVVHGLVLAEIEKFWNEQTQAGQKAAVAEIPLYFESGYAQKIHPAPYVVGISCPEAQRWARIAESRGWSAEKIQTLEKWQWPEDRKMAACDEVVSNTGDAAALRAAAAAFATRVEAREQKRASELRKRLALLCAC